MNNPLAVLFEQFLRERTYLRNVTPATLLWYRVAMKNYRLAFADGALPTRATLQQFVIGLRQRNIRPVTVNTYIGALNAFCRWLHEEGHASEAVRLQKLRVERRILDLLDDAQMRRLITYKPNTYRETRLHVAALLVLDTGLRISEVLGLRDGDINADNLILKVFGKGQKERLVPFSPELRKRLYRLQQLRAKKSIPNTFVFAGFGGVTWEKRNATTALHLLQKKLGVTDVRLASAAAHVRDELSAAWGDIVRLSMVMGHTQISTTQRYLHLLTEDLSASHQRLSILNRLG